MDTNHTILNKSSCHIPEIQDESIALVVTSPPYPMIEMWDDSFQSQLNMNVKEEESSPRAIFEQMHKVLDKVWDEMHRVLIPGGIMCINIGDATKTINKQFSLYSNHSRILSHCISLGFDNLPNIIWRKQTNSPNKFMGSGMLPVSAYVTLEHEYILIFRKGTRRVFKNENEIVKRRESAFFWEERNIWFSDIWNFNGTSQSMTNIKSRVRSGAFPFELPYRLINMYSIKGDTVLDPFLGTGTTMLAAMASQRNSMGIELNQEYVQFFKSSINELKLRELNKYIKERLDKHIIFVNDYEKQKKILKHINKCFGFKVVTSQECDIIINFLDDVIEMRDSEYNVSYCPTFDSAFVYTSFQLV